MKRVLVCLVLLLAAQIAAAEEPAVADARAKVEAGQYKEALQSIAKTLNGMPRDGDPDVQYQLFMLKGESLLQTKAYAAASAAFESAAYATRDPKLIAPARATAVLIKASMTGKYRPRTGGGAEPIDIISTATRPQAMAALRADLARQIQPAYEKAIDGDSLPPMINLVPKMLDLGYVEYMADGSAPKTREDLARMGARARELINAELRRINTRTVQIDNVSHSQWDGATRGIHSDERDELRNNVTYLKQIEKTARDARRFAMELGFDGKVWEPIIADSADLADRSQALVDFIP